MVKTDLLSRTEKTTASKALAGIIIEAIREKKGKDILLLNLKAIENAVWDYFIICHGDSERQVEAIAGFVEEETRAERVRPWHREGIENRQWIILDYVEVAVHIFQREARRFYDLESLWADAAITRIRGGVGIPMR